MRTCSLITKEESRNSSTSCKEVLFQKSTSVCRRCFSIEKIEFWFVMYGWKIRINNSFQESLRSIEGILPLILMIKTILMLLFFIGSSLSALAQISSKYTFTFLSPIELRAQEAQKNMMDQLGIVSLRPGASSKSDSPDAANYKEEQANPCPVLPAILTNQVGEKISTLHQWKENRRPEVIEKLETQVYGKVPISTPSINWEIIL